MPKRPVDNSEKLRKKLIQEQQKRIKPGECQKVSKTHLQTPYRQFMKQIPVHSSNYRRRCPSARGGHILTEQTDRSNSILCNSQAKVQPDYHVGA